MTRDRTIEKDTFDLIQKSFELIFKILVQKIPVPACLPLLWYGSDGPLSTLSQLNIEVSSFINVKAKKTKNLNSYGLSLVFYIYKKNIRQKYSPSTKHFLEKIFFLH